MAKDPIKIGDLYESVPRGKNYEVVATGVRTDWMIRPVLGGVRRIERSTEELNDPHKWNPIGLDELTPKAQADTLQGQGLTNG